MRTETCMLMFALLSLCVRAQDVGQLKDLDPVALNGSIRLQAGLYGFQGESPRASRYHYSIYARPVLSVYGMRFPVTIAYYAQEARLSHPFNRFGVSPYYKWAKLHLGHRSMRLSKYTLSGKVFLGAGVELTPGKLRFSALYGKLQNHLARRDTLVIGVQRLPAYNRFVYGGKIGVGSRQNHIDFVVVKTTDDPLSNEMVGNHFLPEASLATGLSWQLRPVKRLTLRGEIAGSIFTLNQNSEDYFVDEAIVDQLSSLIVLNHSSRLSLAGEASLDVRLRSANIGLQYKRVEPFYRSLGTLFYNSDYQDWRFKAHLNLFRSKLNINLSSGLREDNLRQIQLTTNRRWIANGNISYRPSAQFSLQGNYANYQIFEDPVLVNLDDAFRYATLTNQAMFSLRYKWSRSLYSLSLMPSISWQKLSDASIGASDLIGYENLSTRFRVQWVSKVTNWSIRPGINYLKYFLPDRIQERYGFSVGLAKPFWQNKLRVRSHFQFNYNDVNKLRNGHVITGNINAAVQLKKKQSLQIRLSILKGDRYCPAR